MPPSKYLILMDHITICISTVTQSNKKLRLAFSCPISTDSYASRSMYIEDNFRLKALLTQCMVKILQASFCKQESKFLSPYIQYSRRPRVHVSVPISSIPSSSFLCSNITCTASVLTSIYPISEI